MTILLQRISEGEDLETSSGFGAVQSEFGNLPLRQLSYHAHMLGMSLHTTILQTYYNPFDEPIEATYIFPLAYGQAVIACEMRLADRIVHAKLKERGQARRDYAQAIRNGHRAALLEENRPETFSMKVGNIPPGEAIQICIRTVSQLVAVQGEWTLRLPLVVAPRYTSGLPLPRASSGPGTSQDTDQVPDASCVTPPTWLPGFASPIDLKLVVDIDMGSLNCDPAWTGLLASSLHTALIQADSKNLSRCRVELLPQERLNRDFILRGHIQSEQVSSAVVCETEDESQSGGSARKSAGRTTFAVTIVPPRRTANLPRQVVFLLDRSGSMSGWKIEAARRGLCRLVDRLSQADQFQVLAFDDHVTPCNMKDGMRAAWQSATDANRFEAVRWLSRIETRGGTEMGPAIDAALRAFGSSTSQTEMPNRAIVLVTDGQITGEDALLRLIDKMPKHEVPRVFCLGVDRAVNASVLERLTRRTGGTFELVESEQRLDEALARFADEIASPSLTHVSLSDDTHSALNLAPTNVHALYAGRSQTIYGRTDQQHLTLFIRGRLADGQWYEQRVEMSADAATRSQTCLRALWGKERVRQLEDELFATGSSNDSLKQQIIDCSLECQVLSRLTAFVAVDETEKITQGQVPHAVLVPSELPEGWSRQWLRLDPASLMRVPRSVLSSPAFTGTPLPSLQSIAEQAAAKMIQLATISDAQLTHARSLAAQRGCDVCHALVALQYATHVAVAQAIAAVTQTTFIPISQLVIDESILMLLPESVARENHVLPIANSDSSLTVVMSNPHDLETLEKLRFILNRNINAFCGASDEIGEAINRLYGQIEGESADSLLQAFTDTQIDFTQTEGLGGAACDYDDDLYSDGFSEQTYGRPAPRKAAKRMLSAKPELRLSKLLLAGDHSAPSAPAGNDESGDEILAPIVRLVGLLLQEAIKLRASHILLTRVNGTLSAAYLLDGQMIDREKIPGRLWFAVLNRLKLMAKLDIAKRDGVQTGELKISVDAQDFELILHAARESMMIELPSAKLLPAVPAEIESWWQRNAENNSTVK